MLKVAQIQINPTLGDCANNKTKIKSYLNRSQGADLVVLPELADSGYNFENRDHAMSVASECKQSDYISFLRESSFENKFFIVSGYVEMDGDILYNSSVFVTPDGLVGKYRKIHLFMNEKNIFSPGNLGLPIFSINNYKMGILICFDYLFPEIWRILALKNADFIAHPSNLITQNAQKVVPAQAIMNGYYVITTNRVGTEGDLTFSGNSFIADPRGNKIVELDDVKEQVITTSINPMMSRDKMITSGNHILNDRMQESYNELLGFL